MSNNFDDDQLKVAIFKIDEYYMNTLPKDEEIPHQFSRKFERKMKKLIRQSKKNKSPAKPFKRVAILIVSTLMLLASSMSVAAVRKTVFEFISNIYEKYTEIFFESSQSIPNSKFVVFKPAYVPDGFTVNLEDFEDSVYLQYIKGNDYIIYEQKRLEEVSTHINTEGTTLEETELNGQPAKYYSNQGVQNLIWYDDSYMYSISSTLNKNEVFKIAESIR